MEIVLRNNLILITTGFATLNTPWMKEFLNYHARGMLFLPKAVLVFRNETLIKVREEFIKQLSQHHAATHDFDHQFFLRSMLRYGTQPIKIELENDEDLLKPGMFARAIINTYEKKDALIIPASSFKKKENKFFVYIVHPEEPGESEEETELSEDAGQVGIVEEREIKIEYSTHDVAEVEAGLEEGELIVRELHQDYKDQDKVEITEVQETIF